MYYSIFSRKSNFYWYFQRKKSVHFYITSFKMVYANCSLMMISWRKYTWTCLRLEWNLGTVPNRELARKLKLLTLSWNWETRKTILVCNKKKLFGATRKTPDRKTPSWEINIAEHDITQYTNYHRNIFCLVYRVSETWNRNK